MEELFAPDRPLRGCGAAVFHDWIAVLGGFCARDLARAAALRSGSGWWSAGLPGSCSTPQLDRRTEYDSRSLRCDGCGGDDLGVVVENAQRCRRPGGFVRRPDCGEPFRAADRCDLCQGLVARSGV